MSVLDPGSPVPLYAQLAEAIRYRIATGALPAGAPLPPLREAAVQWGVNLHTVRHAYDVLARQGLVQTTAPFGSVVAPDADSPDDVDRFVQRMLREANQRGIGADGVQPAEPGAFSARGAASPGGRCDRQRRRRACARDRDGNAVPRCAGWHGAAAGEWAVNGFSVLSSQFSVVGFRCSATLSAAPLGMVLSARSGTCIRPAARRP